MQIIDEILLIDRVLSDVTLLFKCLQCLCLAEDKASDESINSLIDRFLLHDHFDEAVQLVIVSHFDLFGEQCDEIRDY
jgi:hypothetical protein